MSERGYSVTADWIGTIDTRERVLSHSDLIGTVDAKERVLSHSWLNWDHWCQREGTQSQLTELGLLIPERGYSVTADWIGTIDARERALIHSWVKWSNGGHSRYSFTTDWTGTITARQGTHSQLNDVEWEMTERVIIHRSVWPGALEAEHGTQSQLTELELLMPERRYSVTADWTGTVDTRERVLNHSWLNWNYLCLREGTPSQLT